MPELPDVELYLHALRPRILRQRLERIRLGSPFLVRSIDPPLEAVLGRPITTLSRLGKRMVWRFDNGAALVIHLMIAGRLRWKQPGSALPRKAGLAAFDFTSGTLLLTEAGSKRRASLYVVADEEALRQHDPGGLEVLGSTPDEFATALGRESHTVKRALTDPHIVSGIGNAYSDEILHAAGMSPMKLTSQMTGEEMARLHAATVETLERWRDRLIAETGDAFPEKVTAFRDGMAVHGRYGRPCPICGTAVQRIRYAENEANYCPTCQTAGRLLADRSLSRLLKGDWPRSLEELERRKASQK